MIALAVAMILAGPTWTPGPNDPVCQPGQVAEVDHCSQGQLPDEVIGRQIDGPNGEVYRVVGLDANGKQILELVSPSLSTATTPPAPATPPEPAPAVHISALAYTGVPTGPYAAVALGALLAGAGLVRIRQRGRCGVR